MPSRSSRPSGGLAPSALRGLLDATPAAVGCFDAALRVVYANTAFTMTTGAQTGRVLDEGPLAVEVRAMLAGSGAPAPGAARRRAADADLRHAVRARGRA